MYSLRHNENNENKNSGCTNFKGHMSELLNLQHFKFNKFSEKINLSFYCMLYWLVRVKIFYAEKSLFLDRASGETRVMKCSARPFIWTNGRM